MTLHDYGQIAHTICQFLAIVPLLKAVWHRINRREADALWYLGVAIFMSV